MGATVFVVLQHGRAYGPFNSRFEAEQLAMRDLLGSSYAIVPLYFSSKCEKESQDEIRELNSTVD